MARVYAAPNVQLRARTVPTPSGNAGVFATVRAMRALVNERKSDPRIIEAATSIIWCAPERDELCEVEALHAYVRDSIRYVRDVHALETLTDPVVTMARKVGDCDDQATLLAALLEAVGYPTRFVIGAFAAPGAWDHVWLQTYAAGAWIDADPTEHQPLGWQPPAPLSLWIEGGV